MCCVTSNNKITVEKIIHRVNLKTALLYIVVNPGSTISARFYVAETCGEQTQTANWDE